MLIYDTQLDTYSHHDTVEGLYEMILTTQCECGDGYDVLDEKDGEMKCYNCRSLNNIETITMAVMLDELDWNGYAVSKSKEVGEDVQCLNCGFEFKLKDIYRDINTGTYTRCIECKSSFDV